ncbi:hypothetical protein SDC9_194823 [bioreactor metagenome]|uniref:Uncharacterized protein n=1 Tax=bioreactor metagenome TaxID=1076179 RepID=A0A645I8T1_9ZZZZ
MATAEIHHLAPGKRSQSQAVFIVIIQDQVILCPLFFENIGFGRHITFEIAVPVQMVRSDIQNSGDFRREFPRPFQLKAGNLTHHKAGCRNSGSAIQKRNADIAAHKNLSPRFRQNMPRQSSRGGLTVGAGNSNESCLAVLRH